MSAKASILSYAEAPERFLAALASRQWREADPVSFPLTSRYFERYAGDAWRGDASFMVMSGEEPRTLVRAQATGDLLADNGRGATVEIGPGDPGPAPILEGLQVAARRYGCSRLVVADVPAGPFVSPLARRLLTTGAVPTPRPRAVVDLTRGEAEIRAAVRASYRSLINWGRRELAFTVHRGDPAGREALAEYRAFHVRTAGRETRSTACWDAQADMIEAGCAELALGTLEGHGLVSGLVLFDWGSTTVYASAVYERSLFDKPLAHAGLMDAILRAKARGQERFLLGEVPPRGTASDKEVSIGFFKAGFTDTVELAMDWELPVA